MDGAIVGAERASGRWAAKQSLEFKHPGDRVRVNIPGEYKSLTFACWVRIDSLDRKFNSLFLTDHYNDGEPHWQILETGQLYFSVRPSNAGKQASRKDFKVLSEPFWKPSLSGQWIHLAVTFDGGDQVVTHFLNGKPFFTARLPKASQVDSVRIGEASIGNWAMPTMPNADFAIRNLNGRLDEFIIFSNALGEDEIAEIYEIGRPD